MNQSETKALEALQNGSDIRGIAIATEKYQITLTDERVEKIAYGFAKWLKEEKKVEGQAKVAIGHDSRLSAERLKAALVKGLTFAGINVVDVGLATTPAMFMATQYEDYNCDAGIMITASHLPFMYNGLKLFTKSGGAEHEDIDYIVAHADKSFIENGLNLG
ncbi:phosphomannomutase/phosphoglucomutase, partial [Listeria monocytogenes]|nr:phosphomannomutase/phosphoglucomutase [Listeria monocytogenes]